MSSGSSFANCILVLVVVSMCVGTSVGPGDGFLVIATTKTPVREEAVGTATMTAATKAPASSLLRTNDSKL